jgi:hypothetical protein
MWKVYRRQTTDELLLGFSQYLLSLWWYLVIFWLFLWYIRYGCWSSTAHQESSPVFWCFCCILTDGFLVLDWWLTGTKNSNFVEDHPRNIPAKFGSNRPSGFGEKAWNVKSLQTTDNRRQTPRSSELKNGAVNGKPLGRLEPNLAGMFLGWSSTKLLFFVPVGYSIWLPGLIICSDWLKFQRSSSLSMENETQVRKPNIAYFLEKRKIKKSSI